MKRKIVGMILAALCCISLAACGASKGGNSIGSGNGDAVTADVDNPSAAVDEYTLADGSTCRELPIVERAKDEEINKVLADWFEKISKAVETGDEATYKSMVVDEIAQDESNLESCKSSFYDESYPEHTSYVFDYNDNIILGMVCIGKEGSAYTSTLAYLVNVDGEWKFSRYNSCQQVEDYRNNELLEFKKALYGEAYADGKYGYRSINVENIWGISDFDMELRFVLRFNVIHDDGSLSVAFRVFNGTDKDITNIKFGEGAIIELSGRPIARLDDFYIDPSVTIYAHGYIDIIMNIPEKAVIYPDNSADVYNKYAVTRTKDAISYDLTDNSGHDGYHNTLILEYTSEAKARIDNQKFPTNFIKTFDTTSMIGTGCYVFGNENYSCKDVTRVVFEDTLAGVPGDAWDASVTEDGRVMVYVTDGGVVHIAGEGGVSAVSCFSLFGGYENLVEVDFNNCFYTELCYSFEAMFYYDEKLETVDISQLNTSGAYTFEEMFANCDKLAVIDVSGFDTHNVRDMSGMFYGCDSVTYLDVSGFDTSNVTNMNEMFETCVNLSTLKIGNPDTTKVEKARAMFANCRSLTSLDGSISFPETTDTAHIYNNSGLE